MGWLIRGRIPREQDNIINRGLTRVYRPALDWVLARPKTTLAIALVVLLSTVWPMSRIGSEFIPTMNEGTLLYMPSALPGISVDEASKQLGRASCWERVCQYV